MEEPILITGSTNCHCAEMLIEMRDALLPTKDFHEKARPTIDQVAGRGDHRPVEAVLDPAGQAADVVGPRE